MPPRFSLNTDLTLGVNAHPNNILFGCMFKSTFCYSPWSSSSGQKVKKSSTKWPCSYLLGDFLVMGKSGQGEKSSNKWPLLIPHLYLWKKVVCFVLFCSYEIHPTRMCFRSWSWCHWKALDEEEGCIGLGFHDFLNFRCKSSLNIKLISSLQKFGEIGMCVSWMLLEKILMSRI